MMTSKEELNVLAGLKIALKVYHLVAFDWDVQEQSGDVTVTLVLVPKNTPKK
jgi:hypothetical protein